MTAQRRWGRTAMAVGMVLALSFFDLFVSPAWAQVVKLPTAPSAEQGGAAKREFSLPERIAAAQQRLDELQQQVAQGEASGEGAVAPPWASADEWAERQTVLRGTEVQYLKHMDTLRALGQVRESLRDHKLEAERWQGFREPPPYSIDFVDGLWSQVQAKEREIGVLRVDEGLAEGLTQERRGEVKAAEQALRQATERVIAEETVEGARLRWQRQLSELRLRHAEAQLAAWGSERDLKTETLALRLGERELLRRKAVAAQRLSPLSKADRDAKLNALATDLQGLQAEARGAVAAEQAAQGELEAARKRLVEARQRAADGLVPEGAGLARLQQEVEARQAIAEMAGANVKILRMLIHGTTAEQRMWERRYQLGQAGTPQMVAETMGAMEGWLKRIAQFRDYFRSELNVLLLRMEDQQNRLLAWQAEDGDRRQAVRVLEAYKGAEATLRRAQRKTSHIEAVLGSWHEAMRLQQESASFGERMRGLYQGLRQAAVGFWNYELVAVEDKLVVDGQEIVGKRSVTVGKILEVLLILIVGLWVAGYVVDRWRRIMFRRYPGKESTALLVARLFSLVAGVGLVVFALFSASIPLTVFAFLGGALALGVGFGAQNILNNFISGLILLVERPIKIGDIVEVDGVRGQVATIGTRCCQVRRFDGIDMLIPNSSFLEKNVTNWTLSDRQLRITITLGMAYGCPVRHVMELLKRAADEHAQVQSDPAPEVFLQDFAESAVEFRLDLWLDMALVPNWPRVVSDIRVRIEELCREAGFVIAFPQRDVHLDVVKPIRIELGRRGGGTGAGGPP